MLRGTVPSSPSLIANVFCDNVRRVAAFDFGCRSTSLDRRSTINDIASFTSAAILCVITQTTMTTTSPALAVAPFSPIDALLPAARVKITLDSAVNIASQLSTATDANEKRELLHDLEGLLLVTQNYTRGTTPMAVPQQPAKQYLNAYDDYRRSLSLLEKPGAILVQNGEIDAWKRLKREERVREDADEVRAALNYYTSNLNFNSQEFILTATREERSRLIRDDKIPDVKTVIASDMGLRYLHRNDLLTACDDARAELNYQMKQDPNSIDGGELLDILLMAQNACTKWFALIDERDMMAAMEIVQKEKQMPK